MIQTQERPRNSAEDEELSDTLIAISIVSKRLARKLALLAVRSQFMEGGQPDEQDEQNGRYDRRPAQMRCRYR